MVYYFTPYDTQKRIGHAHNEMCKLVPNDDDWICITDPDVMFLTPDFGCVIEKAIAEYGDQYKIFGCLTNRIGVQHLQYAGMSDNPDISYHIGIAEAIKSNNTVKPCDLVAGFFMLFQKKTWWEIGGFNTSIRFDIEFSDMVCRMGGKIGVIQSLYVWHTYRFGKANPQFEYQHLI